MYAVNVESTDALLAEVARALEKADELCSVVDPEETPFRSKYLARAELDAVLGKMEATRTVASLERREAVAADMGVRIAAAKVRLGGLCVEVEEPASAQTVRTRTVLLAPITSRRSWTLRWSSTCPGSWLAWRRRPASWVRSRSRARQRSMRSACCQTRCRPRR